MQALQGMRGRLAAMEAERAAARQRVATMADDANFLLTDLEGHWEVAVRFCETPDGWPAVVAVEAAENFAQLTPLTVFAVRSAFADRGRIEDLHRRGWAAVQAWPMNAPGLLAAAPGYATDRYVICALTAMPLREAAVEAADAPVPSREHRARQLPVDPAQAIAVYEDVMHDLDEDPPDDVIRDLPVVLSPMSDSGFEARA